MYYHQSRLDCRLEPCALARDSISTRVLSNQNRKRRTYYGEIEGKNGTRVTVDKTVDEVRADEFDDLLLPGGVKNPDHLRTNKTAVQFVRDFFANHKPVAAICHAPWTLIEAGVIEGRTMTSWPHGIDSLST